MKLSPSLNLALLAGIALCASGLTTPAMAVDRPAVFGPNPPPCVPLPVRGIALTADQRLLCFSLDAPQLASVIGAITGFFGSDTALIGIDYRIQDGKLYGVGNTGGIYTIDVRSAALTLVSVLTTAPSGTSFGVDFNPAVDRLRIVSNTGQNLRHNVVPGFVTLVDPNLSGMGVAGAAYTNNDLVARTGTTLFDLDATLDQIVIQSPANAGTLVPTAGLRGVTTEAQVGFDIRTSTSATGEAVANYGFASLTDANGDATLYFVDVLSGLVIRKGKFQGANKNVIDISFPPGLTAIPGNP